MKKLIIFSLLFPVFLIQTQEFDESFLDSLPDDIKEDIMNRSDEQSKLQEDNYRATEYSSRFLFILQFFYHFVMVFSVFICHYHIKNS